MTPQAIPDAPAPTPVLSTTSTSSPARARCHAVESPWTPAPTTRWVTERGSMASVQRRLPALQHARAPVGPDRLRALDPRAQLGLRELAVRRLQGDAVRVAGPQVRDEHLARDLVLAARRDREVDAHERVRVGVEDGRDALLLEQHHVLE